MSTLPSTIQESTALPGPSGGPGSRGSEPQQVLTPGDIWTMLRRRTVLIVVLFVLFLMLSGGGFLGWLVYFPGYRSECLIECVSNIPDAELAVDRERLKREEGRTARPRRFSGSEVACRPTASGGEWRP